MKRRVGEEKREKEEEAGVWKEQSASMTIAHALTCRYYSQTSHTCKPGERLFDGSMERILQPASRIRPALRKCCRHSFEAAQT